MKKYIPTIFFWGAVWGICEATIGYALHLAAVALPGLPGALMFPVGFFCMYQARKTSGKSAAPFYIAAVAASIKLADFLMSGYDAIRIVNPALSILLEGLAVTVIYSIFITSNRVRDYLKVLGMGVLWRALFSVHLFIISLFDLPAGLVTSGAGTLLRFLLLESFYNSLIIYAGLLIAKKIPVHHSSTVRPIAALSACLIAVGMQILI